MIMTLALFDGAADFAHFFCFLARRRVGGCVCVASLSQSSSFGSLLQIAIYCTRYYTSSFKVKIIRTSFIYSDMNKGLKIKCSKWNISSNQHKLIKSWKNNFNWDILCRIFAGFISPTKSIKRYLKSLCVVCKTLFFSTSNTSFIISRKWRWKSHY